MPVLVGAPRDEARLFGGAFFELAGRSITAERYSELLSEASGANAAKVAAQ